MSGSLSKKIALVINLIKEGKLKSILNKIAVRFYSEQVSIGFKIDLSEDLKRPRTLIPITVRPWKEEDTEYFSMDDSNNGLINQLKTCYTITNKEGIPCFRCWAIDASQNEKLRNIWGDTFPVLNEDEVLLESGYTIPKFRGMGIHPAAMILVPEKCKEFGAKFSISFVYVEAINSLRTFRYTGYTPYLLRKEKWFMLKKSVTYGEIPEETLEYYNKVTDRKRKSKS